MDVGPHFTHTLPWNRLQTNIQTPPWVETGTESQKSQVPLLCCQIDPKVPKGKEHPQTGGKGASTSTPLYSLSQQLRSSFRGQFPSLNRKRKQAVRKCYRKHADWNRLPWPGTVVTICMSCFRTGGPGKEQGANKPPPTRRVWERSKGDTTCPTTSQNPSLWHPSLLNKVCTTRKDSESEWLAKDNPETNPITIKLGTASHVTKQFSWVPLPSCSPPGCPFPIKSLALSAHVSPRTIHFRVLDKSPVLGPGRGPPSYNKPTVKNQSTVTQTATKWGMPVSN